MKKIILVMFLLSFLSCHKGRHCKGHETGYKSQGTITGTDMRLCACCGGYFINIDGTTYLFSEESLPPNNLNLKQQTLPLEVMLDWNKNTNTDCSNNNQITITRIDKKR